MRLIKSGKISLYGVADSLQGGRPENQDDWGFQDTPLGALLIVCDGMGGGPGGKTASFITKYEIARTLNGCSHQMPRTNALKMAVSNAHNALIKKMAEVPSLSGMGSTFVAVLINEHSAVIAHAGDSRCYLIRGKRVIYRTEDHSLVGELVRRKALTEEEARTSPQSNVISRGLGSLDNHVADIVEVPYRKGDKFILCTDGVWGIMPHKKLLERFTSTANLQKMVRNLSCEIDNIGAQSGGHHDNHTIGCIEIKQNSLLKDRKELWRKYLIYAIMVVALSVVALVCFISFGKSDDTVPEQTAMGGGGIQIVQTKTPLPANKETSADEGKNSFKFIDIDSIRAKMRQDSSAVDSGKKDLPKAKEQKKDKKIDKKKVIDEIILNLDSMLNNKGKEQEATIKRQMASWKRVKELLADLKAAKLEVDNILKFAEGNSSEAVKVMEAENKQYYCISYGARKRIETLKRVVNELKSKLK